MSNFDMEHDARLILGRDWVEDHLLGAEIVGVEQNSIWIQLWTTTPGEGSTSRRLVRIDLYNKPRRA